MKGNPCNQCDDAQKYECDKANNCLFGIKTISESPIPKVSIEVKIRNDTLDEMIKLSMMIEENETERWESVGRPKNDGYINGSHSGYGHALRDMRQWIGRIKQANGGMKI